MTNANIYPLKAVLESGISRLAARKSVHSDTLSFFGRNFHYSMKRCSWHSFMPETNSNVTAYLQIYFHKHYNSGTYPNCFGVWKKLQSSIFTCLFSIAEILIQHIIFFLSHNEIVHLKNKICTSHLALLTML